MTRIEEFLMSFKIKLCDINQKMVSAWEIAFKDSPEVEIIHSNIFQIEADALVSPANSFGFMDGGLDYHISEFYHWTIQEKVQNIIREQYYGELPVGQAIIVETGTDKFPYLISAPTMPVPLNVAKTNNAYLAMRAILHETIKFNQTHAVPIKSIVIPGLAGATGRMPLARIAFQMRKAYENVTLRKIYNFKSLSTAAKLYYQLIQ